MTDKELADQVKTYLEATTISYPAWKLKVQQGKYTPPDGSTTNWGKAFATLAQIGVVVMPPLPPPPSSDAWTVKAPTPPTMYTIPAGAKILEDGTYPAFLITEDTYARHLGGVTLEGNVVFQSGSLHGVVIDGNLSLDPALTPPVIQDCWVHAKGQDWGIHAYRPDGLIIERCWIDNFTNYGIRASTNTNGGEIIKRLADLYLRGGSQGGATGGRGEACLWVGHPVADGVKRVDAAGGYTCCIWRGNVHSDTEWEDIKADTSVVGAGASWYDEHQTTNCIVTRFWLKSLPGNDPRDCKRTYQGEYRKDFLVGAVQQCKFYYGTIYGGQWGMNFEDGTKDVDVQYTRFMDQTLVGLRYFRTINCTESNNDYSHLAAGVIPYQNI